jgi:hypothetical protein
MLFAFVSITGSPPPDNSPRPDPVDPTKITRTNSPTVSAAPRSTEVFPDTDRKSTAQAEETPENGSPVTPGSNRLNASIEIRSSDTTTDKTEQAEETSQPESTTLNQSIKSESTDASDNALARKTEQEEETPLNESPEELRTNSAPPAAILQAEMTTHGTSLSLGLLVAISLGTAAIVGIIIAVTIWKRRASNARTDAGAEQKSLIDP